MSGAGDDQPPPAVPSVRTALLLVVTCVVAAVGLLVVSMRTSGPEQSAAPQVTCSPPPRPPTTAPRLPAPDPTTAAGAVWHATLTTTCGVIGLELDGAAAPATVASFLALARAGYWTDSVCRRLTTRQAPTGFLQCGDANGRGLADPGYGLPLENVPTGDRYVRGMVGMARGDDVAGTAGEFFMVHRDFTVPADRPVYTVFGRVVEGQAVIDHIAAGGGEDTRPDGPPFLSISVLTVTVTRG